MNELDRIFDLLRKERRRYVLYYLDKRDNPVSVDEITDQIAQWETEGITIPDRESHQIEVQLLHDDLPKVAEAEYIRYNGEEGILELTGEPPEFEVILSIAEIIERPDRNP